MAVNMCLSKLIKIIETFIKIFVYRFYFGPSGVRVLPLGIAEAKRSGHY